MQSGAQLGDTRTADCTVASVQVLVPNYGQFLTTCEQTFRPGRLKTSNVRREEAGRAWVVLWVVVCSNCSKWES